MPLNLPSHAHGEGYSDMNTVIPELVERVDAEKGPYYAEVGDYGSAGNAHVVFYKTLPQNFVQVDGGMYQFARFVFGASRKLGAGNLLYGGEAYHDGGPWVHPDNYYKFNGLMTYSQGGADKGFSITARGYAGIRVHLLHGLFQGCHVVDHRKTSFGATVVRVARFLRRHRSFS